jgi:hypothetical protein
MKSAPLAVARPFTRRQFISNAGAAMTLAAVNIVPRQVLGAPGQKPPSEKLNIAGIGVGGMGAANLGNLESENIVAGPLTELCLLGNLAKRMDARIEWDATQLKVTNLPEANKYVRSESRPGWSW